MGAKGITIAEECHVVNALAPIDIGGGAKVSDYFSLGKYSHASIIITCGIVGNTAQITVEESDDKDGSSTSAIDFKFAQELTAAGDTLGALAFVGGTGGIATGTNNGTIHVIEIDASQLSDGFPYLVVKMTGAAANLTSCLVVLSGNRYAEDGTPTAIT